MEKEPPNQSALRPLQLVLFVFSISTIWNIIHWYIFYNQYETLSTLIAVAIFDWLFWIIALPCVIWITKKRPPVKLNSLLFVHFPINIIATVITIFSSEVMRLFLESHRPVPFFDSFQSRLIAEGSWYVLFYWFVVGAYFTVDFHAAYNRKKQESLEFQLENAQLTKRLIESRLSMLRAQLQPHFLFNSLNSISSLMDISIARARNVLIQLANLLREALDISDKEMHTLREECEWHERYLSLESIRLVNQLEWSCDLAEDTYHALVPCLILQPLIENSFKHARKKNDEPLSIQIEARKSKDQLIIKLSDNGVGFPKDKQNYHEGRGLKYVREICKIHFGDTASVQFTNHLAGGTTVTMILPLLIERIT